MIFGHSSRLRSLRHAIIPPTTLPALHRDGDAPLHWRQPQWDQYAYRLESPRGLLALMQTVGFFKPTTTVHAAAGVYRLQPRWSGGFKLFLEGEPEPRIDYQPGWWFEGRLERRGGEVLGWKRAGFTRRQIETQDGFPLVTFADSREWFKSGSEITTHDALWRRDDAMELLIVGFAILVLTQRRHSS